MLGGDFQAEWEELVRAGWPRKIGAEVAAPCTPSRSWTMGPSNTRISTIEVSYVSTGLAASIVEACPNLHRTIQHIKELGCKAGVALNPHSPVSLLADIISDLDLVLIMSVNPGFGGQRFIEHTYKKLDDINKLSKQLNPGLLIEVDGGVDTNNASKLIAAGAQVLVAGSSVFSANNPTEAITYLKNPVKLP